MGAVPVLELTTPTEVCCPSTGTLHARCHVVMPLDIFHALSVLVGHRKFCVSAVESDRRTLPEVAYSVHAASGARP